MEETYKERKKVPLMRRQVLVSVYLCTQVKAGGVMIKDTVFRHS